MADCNLAPARADGYAVVWDQGKTRYAHIVAYEEVHGPVPNGLELDHLCRVRNCREVSHLEAVTGDENRKRAGAAKTHCTNEHEYTPANTYVRPDTNRRGCRTCRTTQAQASKDRRLVHA